MRAEFFPRSASQARSIRAEIGLLLGCIRATYDYERP